MLSHKSNSLSKKLKIVPTTLPTIAGNASAAFPASLLSASASLSNHFFEVLLSFDGVPPAPLPPPQKIPVMARTIVEIVMDRAVSIAAMVIPCQIGYGFFLLKTHPYQKLFQGFA